MKEGFPQFLEAPEKIKAEKGKEWKEHLDLTAEVSKMQKKD